MKKQYLGFLVLILMIFALVGCSKSDDIPTIDQGDIKDETGASVGDEDLKQTARTLFNNLINIEAKSSFEEGFDLIDEVVYDPEEYIQSLDKNDLNFNYGNYERATAAHREETISLLDDNHYEYTSMATIEVFHDNGSEPAVGHADLRLEIKKKDGDWRILRVNVSPQK